LIGAGGANETIGILSGAAGSILSLGGTGTLTTMASGNSTFAGAISGPGNFTKAGTGTLTLSADNSYAGTTTVSAGILEIGHIGAIDNSSAISIGLSGQLTGTTAYIVNAPVTNDGRLAGDVLITGNVTNSGGLLPGSTAIPPGGSLPKPGQSMGTITIGGNYTGSGTAPFVVMFVDLDAALPAIGTPGTTHDFVEITGDVGGMPTRLFLPEFDEGADTGLATTGNGIHLFSVGGTTAADAFVQGNALTAGAFQYLLRFVAPENGFFLQSAPRDELFAHPAALSASQAMLRHCFRDDQRVPDSPRGATYGRAWFGYHKGASNFGADTGIDMDLDFSCSTGGMDWRLGPGWLGGVAGGFGSGNIDLTVPSGFATMDGDARVIEVYTAFTSSSFFINLSAGYADMDWAFAGAMLRADPTSFGGLIAGAQAGVALDLDLIAVKLFGALSYDDTNCGDNCFNVAVTEDTGLVEAKGTVRFDGVTSGGSIRPWASVSFSDVLSDGANTVSIGAVGVSSDANQQLLSLDAGLQAYLDENFALFADGGYHESLSHDVSGYKAGAGLKLYW
jgi:autotransporter-associated beta strand protein